jgi:hypothetical protein
MSAAGATRVPVPKEIIWAIAAIWSAAMLWYSLASGVQHDYGAYLAQWDLVRTHANPWATDNAYGPLHNLFAYLVPLDPLAPKLVTAALFLAANAFLVAELVRERCDMGAFVIYLLAVPANVLVVSLGFGYGLNDALVAALVLFALLARRRERFVFAGCLLGLAVLLKYYPAVLVPLFALHAGRVRLRLIGAAATVTLIGLAAGWLMWGNALFQPLILAVEREPKMLSILSALSSYPHLIGGQGVLDLLLRTNAVFVASAGLIVFRVAWRTRMHWIEASVVGLLAVSLTYKVGHPQFYLPWVFLVAALPLAGTPSADRLGWICLPMLLFLSAFQWGYAYGSDGYHAILNNIRRDAGFVAFVLGVATLVAYVLQRRSLARSAAALPVSPNPNSGY